MEKSRWEFSHKISSLIIILFSILSLNLYRVDALGPTYKILTTPDYAPFEFTNGEGELIGIDVEILQAIARDQKFNVEFNTMPFSSGIQALESNQADGMIASLGITKERQKAFDFSEPYFEVGSMFAVKKESSIDQLEDLKGKNVATKIGSQGADIAAKLRDQYGYSITTFEDSVNMYQDVIAGNSVAVIEDYPVMAYAAKTKTIDLKLIGEEIEKMPLGLAVNKGHNEELLTKFNQGLKNIKDSGEYNKILEKYIGDEVKEVDSTFLGQLTDNLPALLKGLGQTILITIISLMIAFIFGTLLGLMKGSRNAVLSTVSTVYVDIMRGLPLLVLAFFIYFGLPQITGIKISAFLSGILTLGLNAAAYVAEIVRGGVQSIAEGQMEAGRSLGLSRRTTMRKIILPQALRVMIPSFINQFIITLKDTSILSVIGLVELTQTGRIIIARTYQSGSMWLIVGLIYILVISILTKLSNRIEKEVTN